MSTATKKRTRLYHSGRTMFRRVTDHRGWGGAYGQYERPAKWACVHCSRRIDGDNDKPWYPHETACSRNGHAPCVRCGASLARLNCGCPREHSWHRCPGKTEADRVTPQHAHRGHLTRTSGGLVLANGDDQ